MRVCLVEDDLALGRALQAALQESGHEVVWVRRSVDARHWVQDEPFDALLLDLGLPDGDGLELLRRLRAQGKQVPILVITARDGVEDRLNGLDMGADDYVIKPFVIPELLARLRAVARRAGRWSDGDAGSRWACKDLVLDEGRMMLTRAGETVHLSRTEFMLLQTLMRYPDRVLTRRELEARALPHSEGQALDVHIFNLRKKLGEGYVRTVRGIGFVVESGP
ncbi:response regulator transcription factor [Paucibacter sp. O1-1]|uniref:response regulator transcription factor n=1 Tax=Roseateles TaxID=93681 RepID=UPI0010F5DEA9|nr:MULTISPECIES: response regulator transcription factor [unclassified Roseateles]MCU7372401.1 response regulator transcription factor [Paucibacter sp. O1-1]MCZ7884375.1 response regulator transcription factor [Paucibacter sp. M5-1]MDA3827394.1 response regulator transcription factor [Paucibacter sp. O1-1]MDC6168723.1 response regulator transcription factor [Paucibacter sp. XJ19-41]